MVYKNKWGFFHLLICCTILNTICTYGNNPIKDNRNIVIICDADDVYQEKYYFIEGTESGPCMMSSNPVTFTIRNAALADSSRIIKKVTSDTLTIENDAERLFIHYEYNPLESFDFFAKAGDSIRIKRVDGIPYLTVSNRANSASVNYDRNRKIRYGKIHGYSPEILEASPSILKFICWKKGIDHKPEKSKVHDLAMASLDDEPIWLDSLYKSGTIDKLEHSFFKERIHYKQLDIQLDNLPKDSLSEILTGYSDSLYRNDIFLFYRKHMNRVVNKLFFTNYIKHAQGSELNHPYTFDKISGDTILHGLLRDDKLYECFKNIADNHSNTEGKLYYNKLLETVKSKEILAKATKEYGEKFTVTVEIKDDLELLSIQGDTLMFSDLRKSLLGKVLYVDIWASWCVPCRREIPYSHEMAKNYSDEDVVFLYIAWNDTKDKWEKAGDTLGLNKIGKSFLVLNSKDNLWKKQMNISTIPRYMIYDRNGNLVNSNAPRPSSNEIKIELNKLITSKK